MPHGEYLPWVQQACGLKPQYASKLIKAAEWVEMSGAAIHMNRIADTDTLFLLSADATPHDTRIALFLLGPLARLWSPANFLLPGRCPEPAALLEVLTLLELLDWSRNHGRCSRSSICLRGH